MRYDAYPVPTTATASLLIPSSPPDPTDIMSSNHPIISRLAVASTTVVTLTVLMALPALAHGDHDARPLVRGAAAGPYDVSLWQVYPDVGSAMTPHLIVVLDEAPSSTDPEISVLIGEDVVDVVPSMTTPGAWETVVGLESEDLVTVTVGDDSGSWVLPTIVVPEPLTSVLPMRLLIAISIFLATAVAWWAAGRTTRAWRRPLRLDETVRG